MHAIDNFSKSLEGAVVQVAGDDELICFALVYIEALKKSVKILVQYHKFEYLPREALTPYDD